MSNSELEKPLSKQSDTSTPQSYYTADFNHIHITFYQMCIYINLTSLNHKLLEDRDSVLFHFFSRQPRSIVKYPTFTLRKP